jgi:hypothetical protein
MAALVCWQQTPDRTVFCRYPKQFSIAFNVYERTYGAYLSHVLDVVTPLADLPYKDHGDKWKKLLPWEIDPGTLSWPNRMHQT